MPATARLSRGSSAAAQKPVDSPRRPGWLSRQRLSLAAGAVVLLCAVYTGALIALVATVIWLLTSAAATIDPLLPAGVGMAIRAILLIPVSLGILLLAKGLLPIGTPPGPILVTPLEAEPDLDALIDYLGEIIGAPTPFRFEFGYGGEFCVRYDGVLGLIRQRIALRLGLATATALSVRELAGLLAEGLAAHAYGTGARRAWIVHQTGNFLAKAAAGGDPVDRWLARRVRGNTPVLSRAAHLLLRLSEAAQREVGWLQRQVERVSRGALAIHERFRDNCVQQVAGLPYPVLRNRINTVQAATVAAAGAAKRSWNEKHTLPPNLPKVIANAARSRSASVNTPSPAALLGCDSPAGELFVDLRRTSRRVSLLGYRLRFHLDVGPADLERAPAARDGTLQRLLRGGVPFAPLGFDGASSGAAAKEPISKLTELWWSTARKLMLALQAETKLDAGLPYAPSKLGLGDGDADALHERCRALEEQLGQITRRLTAASQPVAKQVAATATPAESRLKDLVVRSDRLLPTIWELKLNLQALELLLLEALRKEKKIAAFDRYLGERQRELLERIPSLGAAVSHRLGERQRDILDQFRALSIALRNTPYPVAHPLHRSLESYVVPNPPDEETDGWRLLETGEIAVERLLSVRAVALERLAATAARQLALRARARTLKGMD